MAAKPVNEITRVLQAENGAADIVIILVTGPFGGSAGITKVDSVDVMLVWVIKCLPDYASIYC